MPKIIELTVEIDIQKVSCPGVWLCQGGRVCLTVFALGTNYQTCLLPPVFPLMFKDVFYFKKRFQESCALNNICCLLKDETIYCELVQCGTKCVTEECMILAQYLGAMNDVLFPPNMCSNDGVDLLMRRSKLFPGILSPKIEIATKVRIDEVWEQPCHMDSSVKVNECYCRLPGEAPRQKQVCHSARYHRARCHPSKNSASRSSSRSRSACSTSLQSFPQKNDHCNCTKSAEGVFKEAAVQSKTKSIHDNESNKVTVESHYIAESCHKKASKDNTKMYYRAKTCPCVCEICKRYHELFHSN